MKKYSLYVRDSSFDEACNELAFAFDNLNEAFLFISVVDRHSTHSFTFELTRQEDS
jgi:hypothetical protein